jgi:hypothetical protein
VLLHSKGAVSLDNTVGSPVHVPPQLGAVAILDVTWPLSRAWTCYRAGAGFILEEELTAGYQLRMRAAFTVTSATVTLLNVNKSKHR